MNCIYKLIDDKEKEDIEKTKSISLSRPLLEFGLPEGLIIDFFRDIYFELKSAKNLYLINPSKEIMERITEWYKTYLDTFYEVYNTHLSECEALTDLKIFICLYFQTYCGYFTYESLNDEQILREYLQNNRDFIRKSNKKWIIQIPVVSNGIDRVPWEYRLETDEKTDRFVFCQNNNAKLFDHNIVASLHKHNVEYLDNRTSLKELFLRYNKNRSSATWFKYSKQYLEPQKESRIIFHLPSYEINSLRVACDSLFSKCYNSMAEALFYYSVSVAKNSLDNFPQYVFLRISDYKITPIG